MQTKLHSFLESLTNIMIGYVIALISQLLIFPLFGINISFLDNVYIGLWFTGISLIRSYAIRRYFNNGFWVKNKVKGRLPMHDPET